MASKGDKECQPKAAGCQRCARQRRYLKLIRTLIAYALALAPALMSGTVAQALVNWPENYTFSIQEIALSAYE